MNFMITFTLIRQYLPFLDIEERRNRLKTPINAQILVNCTTGAILLTLFNSILIRSNWVIGFLWMIFVYSCIHMSTRLFVQGDMIKYIIDNKISYIMFVA